MAEMGIAVPSFSRFFLVAWICHFSDATAIFPNSPTGSSARDV